MRNWISINGNIVLQALNDNSGLTYNELEEVLGVKSFKSGSVVMGLYNCLITLNDAGLISVDGITKNEIDAFLIENFYERYT